MTETHKLIITDVVIRPLYPHEQKETANGQDNS